MGIPSNKHVLLSKMATSNGHGENSPYFDGWKAYESDPFHPTKNPQGVIQMRLAENQLCYDLIEEWIKEHPQASFCTNEGDEFKDVAFFQDYHGLPTFRRAIAKFMGRVRGNKATFNPDNIVMSSGATGAVETITFCLADPGDAFLIPSPYYPGFNRDICWRTGVQLIPIPCDSSNKFNLTIDALESTYKKAREESFNVKGLLLKNPSNPLGTILDKGMLKDILAFIREMNIHLVCDEIYAATVFNQPDFISISEVLEETVDYNKDLIHIIYGLSKDMGIPGYRIGIIYSYNDHVISCARKMSRFGLISTQTQHLIASMLSDDDFVERFLSESVKRLALRHKVLTQRLFRLGFGILKSNSGLFFWMDLGGLMKERTEEEEMRLWLEIIDKVKLNISPGLSFKCCEPGWFRVCFTNMDDATMEIALQRIQSFLLEQKDVKDQVMRCNGRAIFP